MDLRNELDFDVSTYLNIQKLNNTEKSLK